MLMKEKHRKSRGFGRPWCTRTHTHRHAHTPDICTEMVEVSFTNVGMHYSSHDRSVCKLHQKVTRRVSVPVRAVRLRLDSLQQNWTHKFRKPRTLQVQREPRWSHRHTAESNKPPHMLMKVCSTKTAHMRPRQLKPHPHGPPGLC